MGRLLDKWRRWVLPGFRSGHMQYTDTVKSTFRDGCRWLDAGGGWHVFCDLYDGERELVARAQRAAVCDGNEASLAKHVSMSERIVCDLTHIPVPDNSFDFITCSMVVEHLPEPEKVFKELTRVLDAGGTLVIHTVNIWSYATLMAMATQMIPGGFRRWMISKVTGREEDDIFPTFYRCNTVGKLRRAMASAGLEVEVRKMPSGPIFGALPPLLALEVLVVRMSMSVGIGGAHSQLLATARKPAREARIDGQAPRRAVNLEKAASRV